MLVFEIDIKFFLNNRLNADLLYFMTILWLNMSLYVLWFEVHWFLF